jgi:hypothetical protein
MIPNLADPDRAQAVRWTAIQAIHAIEHLRDGGTLHQHDIETLRTLADDFIGVADWTKWVREESVISGLFAATHRLQEAVLRDASGFAPPEIETFRRLAFAVETLIQNRGISEAGALSEIERGCALLITRLESYSESGSGLPDQHGRA